MSCWSSVVIAGNAIDIKLTHDHADNSSLFLDHIELSLAIFMLPSQQVFNSPSNVAVQNIINSKQSWKTPSVINLIQYRTQLTSRPISTCTRSFRFVAPERTESWGAGAHVRRQAPENFFFVPLHFFWSQLVVFAIFFLSVGLISWL